MMTRCVVLWALLSASAQAQEWSGVSLESLPEIGVEHLTKHIDRDLWRGALADGALVRIEVLPSVEEAKRAFSFQSRALTSRVVEPGPKVADQAVGGGEDYLLIRDKNVLLSVNDAKGRNAAVHVERLRSLLVIRAAAPEAPVLAPSG